MLSHSNGISPAHYPPMLNQLPENRELILTQISQSINNSKNLSTRTIFIYMQSQAGL